MGKTRQVMNKSGWRRRCFCSAVVSVALSLFIWYANIATRVAYNEPDAMKVALVEAGRSGDV